jgi:hypothetical protein
MWGWEASPPQGKQKQYLLPFLNRNCFILFYFIYFVYRDSVKRFSTSGIFHESVSPKHLSIPVRPF